jgi:hypothetical protein
MGRKHDSIERFVAWRGKRSDAESDAQVRRVADELFNLADGGPIESSHVDALVTRRRQRLSGAHAVMAARSIGDDLSRWDAHDGDPPSSPTAAPVRPKSEAPAGDSAAPRAERSTLRSSKDSVPPSKSSPPKIALELDLDGPVLNQPAKVGSVPPMDEADELDPFEVERRPPLSAKAPPSSYPPISGAPRDSGRPGVSSRPPSSSGPVSSVPPISNPVSSGGRVASSRPPRPSDPRTSVAGMARSEPMSHAPPSLAPPSRPPTMGGGNARANMIKAMSALVGLALVVLVVSRPSCLFSQPAEQVGPGSWTSAHLGVSLDVDGTWTHEPDSDVEEAAEPYELRDAKLFIGRSDAEFRAHLRIATLSSETAATMDDVHKAEKVVKLSHDRRCMRTQDETNCFSVREVKRSGAKQTVDAFEYYFLVDGRVVYVCARFVYVGDAGDVHGQAPTVDATDPDTLIKRREAAAIVASIR